MKTNTIKQHNAVKFTGVCFAAEAAKLPTAVQTVNKSLSVPVSLSEPMCQVVTAGGYLFFESFIF